MAPEKKKAPCEAEGPMMTNYLRRFPVVHSFRCTSVVMNVAFLVAVFAFVQVPLFLPRLGAFTSSFSWFAV